MFEDMPLPNEVAHPSTFFPLRPVPGAIRRFDPDSPRDRGRLVPMEK